MRYIDWNIKCFCKIESVMMLLKEKLHDTDCVIALQEVMPVKARIIRKFFENDFTIIYSIDYREPDPEFDTDNRRLGVMLLISKDFEVKQCGVFQRCLFPERTLYATLSKNGIDTKVVTLHSVTGVAFKMAKAVQFRSFAEAIREYEPDIISFDANEPMVDHYETINMRFFDQGDKGMGARLFFEEMIRQELKDVYTFNYDESLYVEGEPLVTSHLVQGKYRRRYDFIFTREKYKYSSATYFYDEACEASSDHAIIVADIPCGWHIC